MKFYIQESNCACAACGHVFYHNWQNMEDGVIPIERFPIVCPACGEKQAYAISDDEEDEQ